MEPHSVVNPQALFDSLVVCEEAEAVGVDCTAPALHAYSFFGCLLASLDDDAVIAWGYAFVATPAGTPFSRELANAVAWSAGKGLASQHSGVYRLCSAGKQYISMLNRVPTNRRRSELLRVAVGTSLAVPMGILRAALLSVPGASGALSGGSARYLGMSPTLNGFREQFLHTRDAHPASEGALFGEAIHWALARGLVHSDPEN